MDQKSCDAIRHEVPMGQTEQGQRATQQRRSPQVRRVRKEGVQREGKFQTESDDPSTRAVESLNAE